MAITKKRSQTSIIYFVVTIHDDVNIIDIPQDLNSSLLARLMELPRDLFQLTSPTNFLELNLSYNLRLGLDLFILQDIFFSEQLRLDLNSLAQSIGIENHLKVFLIDSRCRGLEGIIQKCYQLKGLWYYSILGEEHNENRANNFFVNGRELVKLFQRDIERINKHFNEFFELGSRMEFQLETNKELMDFAEFKQFIASFPSFFMYNQMLGTFWKSDKYCNLLSNSTKIAERMVADHEPENRQEILLDFLRKIDWIRYILYDLGITPRPDALNPGYETLILVFPYHNPILRKKWKALAKSEEEKIIFEIITSEQNKDYQNIPDIGDDYAKKITAEDMIKISSQAFPFSQSRSLLIDNFAYLHGLFSYSPILRFPTIGKSINLELGLFKPRRAISQKGSAWKAIAKFGEKLASMTLSQNIVQYLKRRNGQVFCISDLPIEWISLEGIPLCFTHDVCRLPETNYRSLFNEYVKNQRFRYEIPDDIIRKTLVIFGTSQNEKEDLEFKKWHPHVEDLSKKYGFHYKHCVDIESVKLAIEEIKPELLIFDCHGDYDEETGTSYLKINNEKLTGDLVIEKSIYAPLVFLSACNTAPLYGYTGLIGEAFFQAGSFSVVSTFNPVSIVQGTLLYIKILTMLEEASKNAIHSNWLEFISTMLRNTFLQECFVKSRRNRKDGNRNSWRRLVDIQVELMDFRKRRRIFSKITSGKKYKGITFNFNSIKGENFLYSHLGRGDLIYFRSWLDQVEKKRTR